ncbi:DinI-like family protein [Enterobacter cloacae]|uniref:DinI-like family protein n=1 Tax=Enterobacter cloacae TaxID=550 RepID=UPI0025CAB026|nr:DinI-like family protein [Enterobacter cloacae]EKY1815727.1 DinI-like family protein [Enterobacter cloacae]HAS1150537.1 DinI family protein [Enterobacter cloacae]
MKFELPIERTKELPECVLPALERELLKRLQSQFGECTLIMHRAGSDRVSILGGVKEARQNVEEILRQTRESADDWFY